MQILYPATLEKSENRQGIHVRKGARRRIIVALVFTRHDENFVDSNLLRHEYIRMFDLYVTIRLSLSGHSLLRNSPFPIKPFQQYQETVTIHTWWI